MDFNETLENPLENQLNDVVAGFLQKLWRVKESRIEREENERHQWNEAEKQQQNKKLLEEEQSRKTLLETKATQWKKAQDVRDYVAAVAFAFDQNQLATTPQKLELWKSWALNHAMDLDPIASGNALIELVLPQKDGET